jgi:translation initiation factor 2B subunit (eIF-2B alpha/beta/delta family)
MSERCGLGEGTHYGCECVMRRLAEAEARAASEQARRETAEASWSEASSAATRLVHENGDLSKRLAGVMREYHETLARAESAEASLSAALRRAEEETKRADKAERDYTNLREGESVDAVLGASLIRQRDEAVAARKAAESRLMEAERLITLVRGSTVPMLRGVIDDLDALGHRGLARDLREQRELLHRQANAARTGGDAADERSGA